MHHGQHFLHCSILWRRPQGKATTPKIPTIPFPKVLKPNIRRKLLRAAEGLRVESWELYPLDSWLVNMVNGFSSGQGLKLSSERSEVPSSI